MFDTTICKQRQITKQRHEPSYKHRFMRKSQYHRGVQKKRCIAHVQVSRQNTFINITKNVNRIFIIKLKFIIMFIMSVLRHIQQYPIYIFVICLEIYRSGASGTFINTFLLYDLIFLCLTPLSAIFQLYHGDQF